MHPAYVVPGATLTIIFLVYEALYGRSEGIKHGFRRFGAGILGLAVLIAISLAIKVSFPAVDAQSQQQAHHILTAIRIPRHSDPARWLDLNEILQCGLCLAAALLLPPGRFRFAIRAGLAAMIAFTALAFLPDSETYRLIGPWRLSVVIVPLASIALVSLAVIRLKETDLLRTARPGAVLAGSLGAVLVSIAVGASFTAGKFLKEPPAYAGFVRANLASGQQYLTSPRRAEFRLLTGAPQFVSFKSHPYQDLEVLEWNRRLRVAQQIYEVPSVDCDLLARVVADDRVTHMLAMGPEPVPECDFATKVFEGGTTKIYALARPVAAR
jgi:hypothetical protein